MFENLSSLFSALGLGYLVLTAWPLAKTDIKERRLPNKYVLPAFPITWLGQFLAGLLGAGFSSMVSALITGVATFAIALVINRAGLLGMGDVKLMAAMAVALGWYSPLLPALAFGFSFMIAGTVALGLLVLKRIRRGGSMALGPYLLAGFFGAISWAVWS